MDQTTQVRMYGPATSTVFRKTKERFGGLSNMAPGFPLRVNGVRIRTSEALYQACRFPHMPDLQRRIIAERSPMTAKMRGKPFRENTRPDWNAVRVKIMRWCLRVKLAQNWDEFSRLLLATGDRSIVEQSRRDDFWGAKVADDGMLVGMNVLGRLLMELREHLSVETSKTLRVVEPPSISEFLLFAEPIETVWADGEFSQQSETEADRPPTISVPTHSDPIQASFFDDQFAEHVDSRDASAGESGRDIVLAAYASYRESGVEWLGDVPAHWEVRRLGQFGTFSKGNGGNKEDEVSAGVPCIRYGDLYTTHQYFILNCRSFVSSEVVKKYTPLRFGDVLFAASGETVDEIGKSAVNLLHSEACCGGDIILFRPKREVEPRYMGYATDCQPAAVQKATMGRGITVIHIYADQLKRMSLALPSLAEQTAIVRFLDHTDRRLRRYIRAKEKLIALLEEQKQAIIHHAVTGRIDVRTGQPYPSYKPSRVEWLEEVPAHWQVVRNGRLFAQRNEIGFAELPILEVSLRTGVRVRDLENSGRKQVMSDRNMYKRAVKGDIAYNMMRMWQGAVGTTPIDGLVSPAYVVAKPLAGAEPRYFSALFQTTAYMSEVDKFSRGIVKDRNRLYWEDFKQMPTPCPQWGEQVLIADAIDHGVATIDERIRLAERQIDLLREYRTRLISDVVTGKLERARGGRCAARRARRSTRAGWRVRTAGRKGQSPYQP